MTGYKSWLMASLVFMVLACEDDASTLGSAYKSLDEDYGVIFTDTSSIRTSTVLLDSLPTSVTGTLLLGKYADPKLGAIESTAYFQLGFETSWSVPETAVFDSVVLILPYSGYSYGDTVPSISFQVCQVTKDFTYYSLPQYWIDEKQYSYFNSISGLFNTSTFTFNENNPLASFAVKPRPNTDSIEVRLSDALGNEWFEEAKKESGLFTSLTDFQKEFKGIAVKSSSANSFCIFGVKASEVKIRIHYRQHISGVLEQKTFDLPYNSAYYKYNAITADRDNTVLEELNSTTGIISSQETAHEAFIQSGVGLVAKIEFPHIKQILNQEDMIIVNNALLVIEPVHSTYTTKFPLPATLALLQSNRTNLPLGPLYVDYTSDEQIAGITYDPEYGTASGYTFTITEYIQSLLTDETAVQTGRALILTTPVDVLTTSVTRACIGSGKNADYKMKLQIYYTIQK